MYTIVYFSIFCLVMLVLILSLIIIKNTLTKMVFDRFSYLILVFYSLLKFCNKILTLVIIFTPIKYSYD